MTFSSRVPADLGSNRLTRAVRQARAAGRAIVDLTESNPTRAEFEYSPGLLAPLAHSRGLVYEPSPFGLLDARRAVARDYERRGVTVSPDRIALSASTSDAYSLLFKLLTDAGDEVLVPRPSYPLFDHLTRLDEVVATPYDIEYTNRWTIDVASVERNVTGRTRALLLVNPNNPTGSFVKRDEFDRLKDICAEHDVALIADEVFGDYELEPGARAGAGRALDAGDVLVFSLGGLSKSAGLPQVKLGWIAVARSGCHGREGARAARARLRHVPVSLDARAGRGLRAHRAGGAGARADTGARRGQLPVSRRTDNGRAVLPSATCRRAAGTA